MKYITEDDRVGIESLIRRICRNDMRAYGDLRDFEIDLEEQGILTFVAVRAEGRIFMQAMGRVELAGVPDVSWRIEITRFSLRRSRRRWVGEAVRQNHSP